jgi:transposase
MSHSRPQRGRAASRPDAGAALDGSATPVQPSAPSPSTTAPADQPAAMPVPIGVGIDTSRYGHYASFLRADLQPAAGDLKFVESALGYRQLRERLDAIAQKHDGPVHFHVRLDLAGRYADNLLIFLHELPLAKTISCGDPQRNKNYRAAIYGQKKSDPVESAACARYALTEKPKPTPPLLPPMRLLCQIASRLESQARQCTRVVNQLHNLLARTFPELALLVSNLRAGWVLALLDRYPTAARLATARATTLERIPYLPHEHIATLLEHARASVASLTGPAAEELVRDLVQQTKDAHVRHQSLEKLLVNAYRALPFSNHLDSIIGFGEVTAAILTAKVVDPERFVTPGKLVGHLGIFPVEASSGIDRDGKARLPIRMIMCKRGNDLVRRYLWLAALSASQHNPAVKPLYQRVRAKHPDQPSIAIGHAMRKLLHLALAVWKSGQPFNPEHYPWNKPAHLEGSPKPGAAANIPAAGQPAEARTQAAGHNKPAIEPVRSVVTAACATSSVAAAPASHNTQPAPQAAAGQPATPASDLPGSPPAATAGPWLDFEHLKAQLPLTRVLEHLGLWDRLRGMDRQRKGPCPVHAPDGTGKTFSVQLDKNVFHCFDPHCGIKGDVIDLWAVVKGLNLREAALDLVRTFNLEPAPGTEKRHG